MINLDSILKSRDITLLTNVRVVKDFFFSSHVWIWELYHKEGWASKNLCFELWFWGRLLRVLWNANSALKIKPFNPEYSLERLMLKLKLQYFGHLMWRSDSSVKTLMLGKIEGRWRRGWQRMRWLDGIIDSMDMSWASSEGWGRSGKPDVLQPMGSQRVGHDWITTL